MDFLNDLYLSPLIGYTIDSFLGVEDETRFDATNKEVRAFKREWVYPMYRDLDFDELVGSCENTEWAASYLQKMNGYFETIECRRNDRGFKLPSARKFTKLRKLTFAVPLILDVTRQSIHIDTYRIWGSVDRFLQSICVFPNKLESVRIVPGIIKLVRTDPDTGDYVSEHILNDRSEGTHMRYYRRFGAPVLLMFAMPSAVPIQFHAKDIHLPSWLMSFKTRIQIQKHATYTDWDQTSEGTASAFLDLFA